MKFELKVSFFTGFLILLLLFGIFYISSGGDFTGKSISDDEIMRSFSGEENENFPSSDSRLDYSYHTISTSIWQNYYDYIDINTPFIAHINLNSNINPNTGMSTDLVQRYIPSDVFINRTYYIENYNATEHYNLFIPFFKLDLPGIPFGVYISGADCHYNLEDYYLLSYPLRQLDCANFNENELLFNTYNDADRWRININDSVTRQKFGDYIVEEVLNLDVDHVYLDNIIPPFSGGWRDPVTGINAATWEDVIEHLTYVDNGLDEYNISTLINIAAPPYALYGNDYDEAIELMDAVDGFSFEAPFHRNTRIDIDRMAKEIATTRLWLENDKIVMYVPNFETQINSVNESYFTAALAMIVRNPEDKIFNSRVYFNSDTHWKDWPARYGAPLVNLPEANISNVNDYIKYKEFIENRTDSVLLRREFANGNISVQFVNSNQGFAKFSLLEPDYRLIRGPINGSVIFEGEDVYYSSGGHTGENMMIFGKDEGDIDSQDNLLFVRINTESVVCSDEVYDNFDNDCDGIIDNFIYAVSPLDRYLQDEVNITGEKKAELYSGKNEYESFQIVVANPTNYNISKINLNVSSWVFEGGVSDDLPEVNLYRAHYVETAIPSLHRYYNESYYYLYYSYVYDNGKSYGAKKSGFIGIPLANETYWQDLSDESSLQWNESLEYPRYEFVVYDNKLYHSRERSVPAGIIPGTNYTYWYYVNYYPLSKVGLYPDALIPFKDPYTDEEITNATYLAKDFTVEPNKSQSYWVDVYVGGSVLPGNYTAEIEVLSEGKVIEKIPLELTVWDITLPNPRQTTTWYYGFYDIYQYYGLVNPDSDYFNELLPKYQDFVYEHGIYPNPQQVSGNSRDSETGVVTFSEAYHTKMQEHIEKYGKGIITIPSGWIVNTNYYNEGIGEFYEDELVINTIKSYNDMINNLTTNGNPDPYKYGQYVIYLDEPYKDYRKEYVSHIKDLMNTIPDLKIKMMLTGSQYAYDILDSEGNRCADLWVMYGSSVAGDNLRRPMSYGSIENLSEEFLKEENKVLWANMASSILESDLARFLEWSWYGYQIGAVGGFGWKTTMSYQTTYTPTIPPNPWEDPITFTYSDGRKYNGLGHMTYHGSNNITNISGLGGPVSSMRLKIWRKAFEDFEYFKILENKTNKETVDDLLSNVVNSYYSFEDYDDYEVAKRLIAENIQSTESSCENCEILEKTGSSTSEGTNSISYGVDKESEEENESSEEKVHLSFEEETPEKDEGVFGFVEFLKEKIVWFIILFFVFLVIIVLFFVLRNKRLKLEKRKELLDKARKRFEEFKDFGYSDEEIKKIFIDNGWSEEVFLKLILRNF